MKIVVSDGVKNPKGVTAQEIAANETRCSRRTSPST
jgi:hypothetical protein